VISPKHHWRSHVKALIVDADRKLTI